MTSIPTTTPTPTGAPLLDPFWSFAAFVVTLMLCLVVPLYVIVPRLHDPVQLTAEQLGNVLLLTAASSAGVLFLLTLVFTVLGRRLTGGQAGR